MNLLVRAPNWLGDVAMSLPFFEAIRPLHPHIVARRPLHELLEGYGTVHPFSTKRELWSLSQKLRSLEFDAGIVLPPSFSSALFMRLSAPRQVIGYPGDGRKFLLHVALPKTPKGQKHFIEEILDLLRPLNLSPATLPVVQFPWQTSEVQEYTAHLRALHLVPKNFVVVAPFAAYGPAKEWPLPRYLEWAERIQRHTHLTSVFVGSANERTRLPESLPGVNLTGQTSLRFLAFLLAHARLVIGNDSGIPHLADILQTPTLMIFGPTEPRWTRPLHGRMVTPSVACAPCGYRTCPYGHHRCMTETTVDQVLHVALSMLEENQGS